MAKQFKVLDTILEFLPKELHAQLLDDAKEYLIDKGELASKDKELTDEEVNKDIEIWAQSNKPQKTN